MKLTLLAVLAVICLAGCCRTRETVAEVRSVPQYAPPPPPVYAPTLEK